MEPGPEGEWPAASREEPGSLRRDQRTTALLSGPSLPVWGRPLWAQCGGRAAAGKSQEEGQ